MDTASPPSLATCVVCQRLLPRNQLVEITQMLVCAECKPQFLQRLQEGLPPTSGVWRRGKEAVTTSGSVFPPRCIKCNAATDLPPLKRVVYWHSSLWYLLILCNVLIYVIVGLIVRRKSIVYISVCAQHRNARFWAIVIGWTGFFVGAGLFVVSATLDNSWFAVAGLLTLLGSLFYGLHRGRLVHATFVDKSQTRLRGLGREFLDSLPSWSDV